MCSGQGFALVVRGAFAGSRSSFPSALDSYLDCLRIWQDEFHGLRSLINRECAGYAVYRTSLLLRMCNALLGSPTSFSQHYIGKPSPKFFVTVLRKWIALYFKSNGEKYIGHPFCRFFRPNPDLEHCLN